MDDFSCDVGLMKGRCYICSVINGGTKNDGWVITGFLLPVLDHRFCNQGFIHNCVHSRHKRVRRDLGERLGKWDNE